MEGTEQVNSGKRKRIRKEAMGDGKEDVVGEEKNKKKGTEAVKRRKSDITVGKEEVRRKTKQRKSSVASER